MNISPPSSCTPWATTLAAAATVLLVCSAACTTHPESVAGGGGEPGNADTERQAPPALAHPSVNEPLLERDVAASKMAPVTQSRGLMFDAAAMPPPVSAYPLWRPTENRERYADYGSQPIFLAAEQPVSTFSIDVDTGAYCNVRRMLNDGLLPPADAVRVEEMINYFAYDYAQPQATTTPFSINMEMTTTPWNPASHLLQIGLQGMAVDTSERPAANLVFLVDVSGSMHSHDKLPLLQKAFTLLTRQLNARDSIALVVYAGSSGVVLKPTPGDQHAEILAALNNLRAGGSTHGSAGINLAYELAQQNFVADGINRVVLATDGDFNVGVANVDALLELIEDRRRSGVSLTTLGFGTGNYNDELMEQLADHGNGQYAYIDSLREAQKVLVEELGSTLQTIAKDVKIQVEFNPAVVAEYRLIGYENRVLNREDFNNDRVDAGEIGAGHTVTALYEVTLNDSTGRRIDPLRYGAAASAAPATPQRADEVAFVRLRYKAPDGKRSKLIEQPVRVHDIVAPDAASSELRFAAAVAAFGQQLRGGEHLQDFGYEDIRALARTARAADPHGYRGEFIGLVELAKSLTTATPDRVAAN